MRSSMIPPSASSSSEYFAWPIAIGRELAGERVVEERRSIRAVDDDLGHVRDVEDAGCRAHGVVLGEVGAVAHRHLPAGEVGEAGASASCTRAEATVEGREHRSRSSPVGAAAGGTPPLSWA